VKDCLPHPPHAHREEEILILLSGEVDIILPEGKGSEEHQRRHLKPGQFVYYPALFAHTLQTTSEAPANYLMFKWYSDSRKNDAPLSFGSFNMDDSVVDSEVKEGFCPRLVFEGPTVCLQKLQCHTSTLTAGAGYNPHFDAYDVAIIVIEGDVETLDEVTGPHSVIFYAAGEPHGMRNPHRATARYIVFEFHGYKTVFAGRVFNCSRRLLIACTDPKRWNRKLKQVLTMLKGGVK
jgi:hypothetical protein